MLKKYLFNIEIGILNNHVIICRKNDNGLEVLLVFTNKGNFVSLENYAVTVYFELPNGEVINKVCDINNNMAKFIIDDDITNLVGKINTEVVLSAIDEEIGFDALEIKVKESIRK